MGGVAKIFKNNKIDKYIYIYIARSFSFFHLTGREIFIHLQGVRGLNIPPQERCSIRRLS